MRLVGAFVTEAAVTDAPLKRSRLDGAGLQRRTFGEDVWRCPCGGRRQVLARP
ncbi:hypothetical protein JRI60_21565 [Archangium violaceum]|uniref:hypothetical protein n=1 Tax=Archangium violaceum TaxID=83451 RepID=UPI00194F209A|nr:hypothetical protein [Archangium violaceum]QRO01420.1 hypothetical protein JRI60_21565 [Archangium violaceum]